MSAYSSLPTTNGYPPLQTKTLLARLAAAPPTRIRRLFPFIAVLVLSSSLVVYFVFSSVPLSFSSRLYSDSHFEEADAGTPAFGSSTGSTWTDAGPGSPFFRDTHPALHARLFLARAQAEIRARGLDTCGGQLSVPMVEGYMKAAVPYCEPRDAGAASITCFPARAPSSPNRWWPYPQSFCAAHHLAHTPGWGGSLQDHGLFTGSCDLTSAGRALKDSMGGEVFLGSEFIEPDALLAKIQENNRNKNGGGRGGAGACAENITHPVLFVPRQDRWNPFHVGEDLVTTFLALTLFSLTPPPPSTATSGSWLPSWASSSTTTTTSSATSADLLTALPETYFSLLSPASSSHSSDSPSSSSANATSTAQQQHQQQLQHELTELTHALSHTASLQLVFSDNFIPSENLFAPLWDRIGGRVPRRMGLEGLGVDGGESFRSEGLRSS
ncbi:hypothetical protein B0H16DRAFT_224527 [Mycena metata]|uniref:Uncharacterized protein n=1 Tax=Mycena metata TaxID=1033252 RepID=A0AAD7HY80_9AGAR|nr:hypothetical protein B0H16DRAFT_224527 [Mycena metata]